MQKQCPVATKMAACSIDPLGVSTPSVSAGFPWGQPEASTPIHSCLDPVHMSQEHAGVALLPLVSIVLAIAVAGGIVIRGSTRCLPVPGKHPCRGCIRSTESEDAAALTPKAYYNGPAKQGQQPCPQQHNCGGGSLAADPQSGTSMSRQHQRLGSKHSPPPAATGLPVAVSQPATCPPGYQSAAQHDIISVKVHFPTRSFEATASALQQAVPACLAAATHGQPAQASSVCVIGSVQMFVWVAQLRGHLTQLAGLTSGAPAGPTSEAGPGDMPPPTLSVTSAAPLLHRHLAAAAESAGAVGAVDVQVNTHGTPERLDLPASPSLSLSEEAEVEIAPELRVPCRDSASSLSLFTNESDLLLAKVSPPCLTMDAQQTEPASQGHLNLQVYLGSDSDQRVRVLLLAACSGAVLVDQRYDVEAGRVLPYTLEVPTSALATQLQHRQGGAPGRPAVPLRLVMTTPLTPSHSGQPPAPAQLLATTTLLAAPAPLASELCTLYDSMEDQGQAQGLGAGDVWSQHWHPLMEDICLCLVAAHSAAALTATSPSAPSEGPAGGVQSQEVTARVMEVLGQFFAGNGMPAWQAQLQHIVAQLEEFWRGRQQHADQAAPQPSAAGQVDEVATPPESSTHQASLHQTVSAAGAQQVSHSSDQWQQHEHQEQGGSQPAYPQASAPPQAAAGLSAGPPAEPDGVRPPAFGPAQAFMTPSQTVEEGVRGPHDSGSSQRDVTGGGGDSSAPSFTSATSRAAPSNSHPAAPSRLEMDPPPPFDALGHTSGQPGAAVVIVPVRGSLTAAVAQIWICLQLLVSGFPNAADETAWQTRATYPCTLALDQCALVLQAAILVSGMPTAAWADIHHLALHMGSGLAWGWAAHRCGQFPRDRHLRACALLVPAAGNALLALALYVGPLQAGLVACNATNVVFLFGGDLVCCVQLQGTLRQWAPIGAALSVKWALPHLRMGVPVLQAAAYALSAWGLSCCLAAGIEIWQRTSYKRAAPDQGQNREGRARI